MSLYEQLIKSNPNFDRDFCDTYAKAVHSLPEQEFANAVLSNTKVNEVELAKAA